VQFDLPREQVTAELLRDLYAGVEEEMVATDAPGAVSVAPRWRCL
jgi:hypothetical protein